MSTFAIEQAGAVSGGGLTFEGKVYKSENNLKQAVILSAVRELGMAKLNRIAVALPTSDQGLSTDFKLTYYDAQAAVRNTQKPENKEQTGSQQTTKGPGDPPACCGWNSIILPGLKSIWNTFKSLGQSMTNAVPNVLTYDVSYSSSVNSGGSYTFTMNYITRGQYRGFYPTTTFLDLKGYELAYGINLGYLYYHGNGDLNPNTLTGSTRSLSFGNGVYGINANFGYTDFKMPSYQPILSGNSAGLGFQLGGSWGTGQTWPGWTFRRPQ